MLLGHAHLHPWHCSCSHQVECLFLSAGPVEGKILEVNVLLFILLNVHLPARC